MKDKLDILHNFHAIPTFSASQLAENLHLGSLFTTHRRATWKLETFTLR